MSKNFCALKNAIVIIFTHKIVLFCCLQVSNWCLIFFSPAQLVDTGQKKEKKKVCLQVSAALDVVTQYYMSALITVHGICSIIFSKWTKCIFVWRAPIAGTAQIADRLSESNPIVRLPCGIFWKTHPAN